MSWEQSNAQPAEHWIATWATAEELAVTTMEMPDLPPDVKMPDFSAMRKRLISQQVPDTVEGQTVRLIVHTSIGGEKLRIELSNGFGKGKVSVGEAHVAIRVKESTIDSESDRQLTFGGNPGVNIEPGAVVVSDPVDLRFKPMSDLAISLYITKSEGKPTGHWPGLHTSYLSDGNSTRATSMPEPTLTTGYMWLRSVDVVVPANGFAVACLGDSITDGFGTTVDRDQAWPTLLAKRFIARKSGLPIAVINEGISGNQLLRDGAGVSALARFDRDIIAEPGVRWVILYEGINDINIHGQVIGPRALVADDLIKGYRQIISRAHMHDIRVAGVTLTPDEGVWPAGPVGEVTRQRVNKWIRTAGEFDAVVDLDVVLRDKNHPTRLREEFDPGDHIHPNDAGNSAMANAFDLSAFKSEE